MTSYFFQTVSCPPKDSKGPFEWIFEYDKRITFRLIAYWTGSEGQHDKLRCIYNNNKYRRWPHRGTPSTWRMYGTTTKDEDINGWSGLVRLTIMFPNVPDHLKRQGFERPMIEVEIAKMPA